MIVLWCYMLATLGFHRVWRRSWNSARILIDSPKILFLFVGDGAGKEQLIKQADGLPNIRFLPFRRVSVYLKFLPVQTFPWWC